MIGYILGLISFNERPYANRNFEYGSKQRVQNYKPNIIHLLILITPKRIYKRQKFLR